MRKSNLRARLLPLIAAVLILPPLTGAAAEPACSRKTFENDPFIICAVDARTQELRIASTDKAGAALRSFDALAATLGPAAKRVRFAMNAGMFNDDGMAVGLLIENGAERHAINTADGPGNFHMKPNGVFSMDADGTVRVETAEAYIARAGSPAFATQSGPMLVINGKLHPGLSANGPSHYLRNGVGVRGTHTAYFVISGAAVSFGKFARVFRDKLKCDDALFFDGSVSSLWAPSLDRKDSSRYLGPMVVVLAR